MSSVKKITIGALCVALCAVLPTAFHAVGLGTAFSPMHLPVLLCGIVCGPLYGLLCGILGPVLANLITGMPPAARMIYFIPELVAYGGIAGLIYQHVHTGKLLPDLYLALVPAMVLGRVVGGVAQGLFFLASAQEWSVAMWASAYFVSTVPGIILDLIAIPALVIVLERAKLIPRRYAKQNSGK